MTRMSKGPANGTSRTFLTVFPPRAPQQPGRPDAHGPRAPFDQFPAAQARNTSRAPACPEAIPEVAQREGGPCAARPHTLGEPPNRRPAREVGSCYQAVVG